MNSLLDRFVVAICRLIARLPFWILFGLSDFFYVLLYYVARYRRETVHENLTRSFPEKSKKEIRKITKKFYHHLSDLGLETIKFSHMTEKEMNDRIKFVHLDILDKYYDEGKSVILLGIHHNNWEWCLYFQHFIKSQAMVVYNQVRKNKELERFLLESRERFGAKSIPINRSVRTAFEFNHAEKPGVLILLADQSSPSNSQFWTTFLNQETAFFSGPMKIAMKTNQPVVLFHVRKVGRSRYEGTPSILVENPSEMKPEDIMMAYVRKIEEIIRAEPEYWLWSHRRWKHKRPANIELYEGQ
jgi:KDO2-lipid IV(A) lauroyltransferase